jgi:hypothetical protein
MEDEVQLWGVERGCSIEDTANFKGDMLGKEFTDSERECESEPCAYFGSRTDRHVAITNSAIFKGEELVPITEGIP